MIKLHHIFHFIRLLKHPHPFVLLYPDKAELKSFYLRNHTLRILYGVPSLVVCGEKCTLLSGCRSLNYRQAGGICELNGGSRADFPGDLLASNGEDVVYLERASSILKVKRKYKDKHFIWNTADESNLRS